MKKIGLALLGILLVLGLVACVAGGSDDGSSAPAKEEKEKVYGVGDTWTVDDQWKFTIDSVELTDERNEFEESNPEQVIRIKYHYENLGYEDDIMDGLFIDLGSDGQLIDSDGNVCSEYPLGDMYAKETPVGAKCSAETYFGLKKSGSPVKLNISIYDGNSESQKATYELKF